MELDGPSNSLATIYLSNLPKDVTAADVEKLLFEFGDLARSPRLEVGREYATATVEFLDARDAEAAVRRIDGMPFGFRHQKLIAKLGSASASGGSTNARQERSPSESKPVWGHRKSGSPSRHSRRHFAKDSKLARSDLSHFKDEERDASSSNYRRSGNSRSRYERTDASASKERIKTLSPLNDSPEYRDRRRSTGDEVALEDSPKYSRRRGASLRGSSREFCRERDRRSRQREATLRYDSRRDAYRRENRSSRASIHGREKLFERSRRDSIRHLSTDRIDRSYRRSMQRRVSSRSSSQQMQLRRSDSREHPRGEKHESRYFKPICDERVSVRAGKLSPRRGRRRSVISRSGSRVRRRDFSGSYADRRRERSSRRQRSFERLRSESSRDSRGSDIMSRRSSRVLSSETKERRLKLIERRSDTSAERDFPRVKRSRTSLDSHPSSPKLESKNKPRSRGSCSLSRERGRSWRAVSPRYYEEIDRRRRSDSRSGRLPSPSRGRRLRSDSLKHKRSSDSHSSRLHSLHSRDRIRATDAGRNEMRARRRSLEVEFSEERRLRSSSFRSKDARRRSRLRDASSNERSDSFKHRTDIQPEEKPQKRGSRQHSSCSRSLRSSVDKPRCSDSESGTEQKQRQADVESFKCLSSGKPQASSKGDDQSCLVDETAKANGEPTTSSSDDRVEGEASLPASVVAGDQETMEPRRKNKWKSRWGVALAASSENTSSSLVDPAIDATAAPEAHAASPALQSTEGVMQTTSGEDGLQNSPPSVSASSGAATATAFSVALRGSSGGVPFPSAKAKPDSTDQRAVEKFLGSLEGKPKIKIRIGLKTNGQIQHGHKGEGTDSKMEEGTSAAALAAAYLQASGGSVEDIEASVVSLNDAAVADAPPSGAVDESVATAERRDTPNDENADGADGERVVRDAAGGITALGSTLEVETSSSSIKNGLPVAETPVKVDEKEVSASSEERDHERLSRTPASPRGFSPENQTRLHEKSSDSADPCLAESSVADDGADSSGIFARRKLAREGPSQRRRCLTTRRSRSPSRRSERKLSREQEKCRPRRSDDTERGVTRSRERDVYLSDANESSSKKEFKAAQLSKSREWDRHRRASGSSARGASVGSDVQTNLSRKSRRMELCDSPTSRGSVKVSRDRNHSVERKRGDSREADESGRWRSAADIKRRSRSPLRGKKSPIRESESPRALHFKRSRSFSRRLDCPSSSSRSRWNSRRGERSLRDENREARRVEREFCRRQPGERADSLPRLTRSPSRRQGSHGRNRDRSFSRPPASTRAPRTPRRSLRRCASRSFSVSRDSSLRSPRGRGRMTAAYAGAGRYRASSKYDRSHTDSVVGCSSGRRRREMQERESSVVNSRKYSSSPSPRRIRSREKTRQYSQRSDTCADRRSPCSNMERRRGDLYNEQKDRYDSPSRSPSRPYISHSPSYGSMRGRSPARRRSCTRSRSESRRNWRQSVEGNHPSEIGRPSSMYRDRRGEYSRSQARVVPFGSRGVASRQELRSTSLESRRKRDTRTGKSHSLSKSSSREPPGERIRGYRYCR